MWDMCTPLWDSVSNNVMNEYFNSGKKCISEDMRKIITYYPRSTAVFCVGKNDAEAYKEMLMACKDAYITNLEYNMIPKLLDVLCFKAAPAKFFRVVFEVFDKELSCLNLSQSNYWRWFTPKSAYLIRHWYLIDDNEKTFQKQLELIERLELSPMVRSQVKGFLFLN